MVATYLQGATSSKPEQIDRVLVVMRLSITDNLTKTDDALAAQDYPALGRAPPIH